MSTNQTKPEAEVVLIHNDEILEGRAVGAGSVDAIYKTVDSLINEDIHLIDYVIQAVTEGTDALGEVVVRIKDNDRVFTGRGSSTDVLIASTKAYLMAINKMLNGRLNGQLKPTTFGSKGV